MTDQGLVHYITIDTETDFPNSGEKSFEAELKDNQTLASLLWNETSSTSAGPFGNVSGSIKNVTSYEQYKWLEKDLASVNRTQTPWILVTGHKPMYSSQTSAYQKHIRDAFEALLLEHKVDAYFSGHIHWYERIYPIGNSVVNNKAVINNNTYSTGTGQSIVHLTNGAAGNVENHSTINTTQINNTLTYKLDQTNYGPSFVEVLNATTLVYNFVYVYTDDILYTLTTVHI